MFKTYGLAALVVSAGIAHGKDMVPLKDFRSPPATYGTRYRYWVPDASVDVDAVIADIEAIREVGGGGIQFLPYYNFGFNNDPTRLPYSAWDEHAFGSETFKDLFLAALNATERNDLGFTFFVGGNQGQGVPSEPLTKGLAVHLVYGETTVGGGETFEGQLPIDSPGDLNFDESAIALFMHEHEDFGPRKLVGVVAAGVVSTEPSDENNDNQHFTVSVEESSLVDLTEKVVDGSLTWDAPRDYDNYTIFAFYERYTNQRSVDGGLGATDIIGNGSWLTDHFSAAGAQIVIDFWEDNILEHHMKQLLKYVGEHSLEDSMEMSSGLLWSKDFVERFQRIHGYSLIKYLPLMFNEAHSYRKEYPPYDKTYVLAGDQNPAENKYLQDYREALSDGYNEYTRLFEEWAQTLGLTHSAQVGYHLPLDMSGSVFLVGAPELESLAFPEIDHSLQFVGGVHLNGGNIISSELGATLQPYTLGVRNLLHFFNVAYAAGVNSMAIHGMAYSGEYPNTTWPGYTLVMYFTGEQWNPRFPSWKYLNDTMHFAARTQQVLRTGTIQRDVAFYLYKNPWSATIEYEGADLRNAGFSYEYLGPTNLASSEALVKDGILAPDGPAYRALVFDNQRYITPLAAQNVLEFARRGLAIVVVGEAPSIAIGTAGQEIVTKSMQSFSEFPNVKFLKKSDSLPEALQSIGVQPRVAVAPETPAPGLWSVWRKTTDTDLVYLFNGNETQTFDLTIQVSDDKVPFWMDAWTGEQHAWKVYQRSGAGVSLSVTLAANQSTIFGFATHCGPETVHVTSHSKNIEKVQAGKDDMLVVYVKDASAASVTLSTGNQVNIPALKQNNNLPTIELDPWNLTLESWVPSPNPSVTRSVIETINLGPQDVLRPWTKIPQVQNVSGVGIYTTTFTLPQEEKNNNGDDDDDETTCPTSPNPTPNNEKNKITPDNPAILLNFGPITDTLRVWVNNQLLPPLDISSAETDISAFVVPGQNSIRVETPSSLFNAVKVRIDSLLTGGDSVMQPERYSEVPFQEYGLVGPVSLRVLRRVVVEQ